MVRLAARNVFLLLALEFRLTVCIPDNQSFVSPHPTDGALVMDTVTTVRLTASTTGPASDRASKTPPAEAQRRSANSTEPPSENTTLRSTSSSVTRITPPSDPPAESSSTRASSTNGTRRITTKSIISTQPPFTTPADSSSTFSTNGTRRTTTKSIVSTQPPSATSAESSSTRARSTNGTRKNTTKSIISTQPPSATSAESSSTRAPSTNGTRRTTAQPIISTSLPNDSYSTPAVWIPGGSSAGPAPVTKQPCTTRTSTVAGMGPASCAPSRDGTAGRCLLAVAVLASVLTVFMVSTAVLCTKLSTRKYSFEQGQQTGTEMVCISAVMPERRVVGGRRALLAGVDDSDEDGGDNLTLNSFLPDGDRLV